MEGQTWTETKMGCQSCGSQDVDVDEEREDGVIVLRCNVCGKTWEAQ